MVKELVAGFDFFFGIEEGKIVRQEGYVAYAPSGVRFFFQKIREILQIGRASCRERV